MRLFRCQFCGRLLHFENTRGERCARRPGYQPEVGLLPALEDGEVLRARAKPNWRCRFCADAGHQACNWLVLAESREAHCTACGHNRTVPDFPEGENLVRWRKLEFAKHRLFCTLTKLGLPVPNRADDPERGLAFDFLADAPAPDGPKVLTSHENGLITMALKEADDAEREKMRQSMGGPYRTLPGRLRHEIEHCYRHRLVGDEGRSTPSARALRRRVAGPRAGAADAPRRRSAARLAAALRQRLSHRPPVGGFPHRPGRTTSTSWTRWRPRAPSASARILGRTKPVPSTPTWTSTRTARATSGGSPTLGFRSLSLSTA